MDDVLDGAVAPLLAKYESLDWQSLTPKAGQIDVDLLQQAEPTISAASSTVKLSHERLESIDTNALIPIVAEPIEMAAAQLKTISDPLEMAAIAAHLLPRMLGVNEPRDYLVLIQNPAESRATGGIPGALAIISTDEGKISLTDQTSATAMGIFSPALSVDEEQETLYTKRLGMHMQNVNLTPDFPTAASTARAMWEKEYDAAVDGVLAIDPIVLSNLLEATGPVQLMNQDLLPLIAGTDLPSTLTSTNVTETLLSLAYSEIEDPQTQDLYFAEVASAVFGAFAEGRGDADALMSALMTSTDEGRLLLWSARDAEQKMISKTRLVGGVDAATDATFGVFFNDGTGAKMDYYARRTVELLKVCSDDYDRYSIRLTISNAAPLDAANSLPGYVTGDGNFGVQPGKLRTNYVFYGPAQGLIETATLDGEPIGIAAGKHGLRPVGTVTVELGPGDTTELVMNFAKVAHEGTPTVRVTPTLQRLTEVLVPLATGEACK